MYLSKIMLKEAQIQVGVTKIFGITSFVKEYHTYQSLRICAIGECLLN